MKHILIADTHLGIKKNDDVYIQVFKKLIHTVCGYAFQNNIKSLIHLGDFFDTRKSLSLKVIDTAISSMEDMEDVFDQIHLIVGNHDTYFRNEITPTSLSLFEEHDKTTVITHPTVLNNILMLPYLFDPEDLKNSNCDYCMGHFDIIGFEMNSGGSTSLYAKLNMADFSRFKKILSGHYHVRSIQGNIEYLGAPMQFTFNEINQTLGFYVFDDSSGKTDFIEFTDYPKHVIIKDDVDLSTVDIKGNNIKVVFTNDYGIERNSQIINNVWNKEPNRVQVDYFNINMDTVDDCDDISVMSKIEILYDYFDNTEPPAHIDRKILDKHTNILYKNVIGDNNE